MNRLLAFLLLFCGFAAAQISQAPIRAGASDPATCTGTGTANPNLFYNTTSHLLKFCSATNTWSTSGGVSNNGTLTSGKCMVGDGTTIAKVDGSCSIDSGVITVLQSFSQPTTDVVAIYGSKASTSSTANLFELAKTAPGPTTRVFQVDINGNMTAAGTVNATSVSSGTAPTTLGSATGGFAATCASTDGSAVAGQAYIRCDSTSGFWKYRHQNGTSLIPLGSVHTTVSSGSIGALDATNGASQIVICTATCSVTPLTPPAADYQLCVAMAAGVTGTITLNALGNSAMYGNTAGSAYGTAGTGTAVSTSTTGNRICIVGRDSTHYETPAFQGTFTMN